MRFFSIFIMLFFIPLLTGATAGDSGMEITQVEDDQNADDGLPVAKALYEPLDPDDKARLTSVTVIGRRDIELCIGCDLPKLLDRVMGIQVRRLNPDFEDHSSDADVVHVSLRGFLETQTLILVDGVRQENTVTPYPLWTHISLNHIERIEIVRGPYSAPYGNSAMGGVIYIFTKRADCSPGEICAGGRVDVSNKSNTGQTVHADASVRTDDNQSGIRFGIQGDRSADPGKLKGDFRERTVTLNFDHRQGKLLTKGSLVSYDNQNKGNPEPYIKSGSSDIVSLGTTYYVSHELLFKTLIGYNKDEQFFAGHSTEYTSRRISIKLLGEYYFDFNEDDTYVLTVGLERQRETVGSDPDNVYKNHEKSRYTTGVFTQFDGGHGPLTYQLVVRADDVSGETHEKVITWRGAASYHIGQVAGYDVFGRAGVGRGSRLPSPDGKYIWFQNHEKSMTREAGIRFEGSSLNLDVGVYETDVSSEGQTRSIDTSFLDKAVIRGAVIQGWEVETNMEMGPCDGRGQYTYTEDKYAKTSRRLHLAKHKTFLGVNCNVNPKIILGWGWTHRGERERFDDDENIFDVYGLYRLDKQGKNGEGAYVAVAVNNLIDEENEPERTIWVTFSLRK